MSDYSEAQISEWGQQNEEQRFELFLGLTVKHKQVWALSDDEGCLIVDSDGEQLLPVWPLEVFASNAAVEEWQGLKPLAISLDDWQEKWLPGMENDVIDVAVFPDLEGSSEVISAQELAVNTKLQKKKAPMA
ncbi:DUF2750 domain-containing protein [Neiella marina]|uniref:DUF2750 domain-containing protein n=1 Tax=Neiella holothuriorum TaxID=2870530 RepID=A0ABS7EHJ6_9GAMM|nr:DUF2750 domain-containing protein [Neiella holothuriorum]MBW8191690.1 DUF2750 domain-containing protein [Neiella holothuriorum]